jgi:transcription factor MBP1
MIHENLYSATYSGVPVYEFIHPKSSVMRRKKDGWVNATHILKVANFPKAKRTRILEKDVQTGVHEKVQGGYGKYQGTWVPLKRAIEIAQQFGVLNDLNPVFDYISNGSITPPPAPKHHHATTATGTRKPRTTKPKANKTDIQQSSTKPLNKDLTSNKKPKRQKLNSTRNSDSVSDSTSSDKKKRLTPLSIPSSAQSNIPISSNLTPTSASRNSLLNSNNNTNNNLNSNDIYFDNSSFNKRILKAPNSGLSSISQSQSQLQSQSINNDLKILDDDLDGELNDDADENNFNNNLNNNQNENDFQISQNNDFRATNSFHHRLQEPSTVEFMSEHDLDKALAESETYGELKKPSLYYNNNKNFMLNQITSTQIPSNSNLPLDKSYVKALYKYFIEMDSNPECELPNFITQEYSDFNINQPIDNQGNTALHWACSMGDLKMCEILIKRNCDIHVLNNKGEEPIIRSVIYANCYTRRTFHKLLDLLSDCLLDIDLNSRTLLHHIALATSDKNNLPSSRYYTEILLIKIAETVQSNDLFKEFIDKQDIDGNTALHIMSFNNAQKCIKILLGYNARVDIRNKLNDQVGDYLTENFKNDLNHPGIISSKTDIIPNLGIENYESFNLRPFKPSFNGNIISSNRSNVLNPYYNTTTSNRINNSYMEPFYSQNNITNHGNLLKFNQSSYINNINHSSKTSMKMNQMNIEVFDKLNELSSAFDNEISQKNDDIKELNSIVEQMNNDIEKTSNDIENLLENIFGLKAKQVYEIDGDLNKTIKRVELQSHELENDYDEKCDLLRRLIDRTQAMNLAKIVQECENESLSKINDSTDSSSLESNLSDDVLLKLFDLARLQIIRKKSVNILVNIQSKTESNTEIINSYRRLVSKLSNMPISDVDSSLNSIEECLRRDLDSELSLKEKTNAV